MDVNNIVNMIAKYNEDCKSYTKMLSKYDKELDNVYHEIEQKSFSASEGYYLSKRIQELRSKRRIVKQKIYQANKNIEVFRGLKGTGKQMANTIQTRMKRLQNSMDNKDNYLAMARKYGYNKIEDAVELDLETLLKEGE